MRIQLPGDYTEQHSIVKHIFPLTNESKAHGITGWRGWVPGRGSADPKLWWNRQSIPALIERVRHAASDVKVAILAIEAYGCLGKGLVRISHTAYSPTLNGV